MSFVIAAALIVAWAAGLLWLIDRAWMRLDGDTSFVMRVLALAYITISLAGLFALLSAAEDRGPCIRYETAYVKGAPYRFCVERGEWIR